MSYTNPLSIFTSEQIESLSTEKLKSLKKETLLYFQLSDDATIERNGKLLDKNQVLEIFDRLQTELDLHLKIQRNKPLLEFLEYQKMDFFSDPASQDQVLNDAEHSTAINEILATELNNHTANLLTNVRFANLNHLKLIADYGQKAGQVFQDKTYSKSYRETKAFVDKMREKYTTPFIMNEGLSFHPDLDKQVNPLFYRCFEYLPGPFRDTAFLYAVWCHNDIVNKALTREADYTKYKRLNLKTISKAMEIAVNVADNDSMLKKSHRVKEILKGKPVTPRQRKERPANPSRDKSDSEIKLPKFNKNIAKMVLLVVLAIIAGIMLLAKFTGGNYTEVDAPNTSVKEERPIDTKTKRLEKLNEGNEETPDSN